MSSPEPRSPKEQIADDALTMILFQLESLGLTPEHVFITFNVEEKDEDGENAASVFHGDGDSHEEVAIDLFAFLIAQAKGVGEKLGLRVIVGNVQGGPMS